MSRLLKPIDKILDKTQTDLDNMLIERVQQPLGWVILMVGLYVGLLVLQLPDKLTAVLVLLLKTVGTFAVAWMLFRAIDVIISGLERFTAKTESEMDDHMIPLVKRILRVALISVA
ncbi:MAG: hypothetical protein R3E66_23300 [bacterium]